MEDFGYIKDEEESKLSGGIKKIFLIGATLFSIACFIYVTINAYYFIYQDQNGNIETIKSPESPIKVIESEQNNDNAPMQINRAIYEDIFGNKNKKESLKIADTKVRVTPEAALPPKAVETKAVKESFPTITSSVTEQKPVTNNQKIIVYSDNKQEMVNKDLLTKSEEKKSDTTTKTKPVKRYVRVQVAAMTSRNAAEENWNKLDRLYPSLFSGLKSFIEEVNLGKRGIFYRLQIGNFYNQVEAEEFCNRYVVQARKNRADCIVVE